MPFMPLIPRTIVLALLALALLALVADLDAPRAAAQQARPDRTAPRPPLESLEDSATASSKADASEPPVTLDDAVVKRLQWRSIGPASMGGRIVDLEVVESNPFTFYIATASGGLFKTVNNGTTFAPVFEREATVSIGDVAVSDSDPSVIWIGTGEHNPRNSVSWGNGVYKSTDSGKTWKQMGLDQSFQIGKIAIHPTNPDVVYVAAAGRLWGPNSERGLYQTVDGGATWKQILFVDDQTGCIDIAMHPRDPATLLAAMYERQRDAFDTNDPAKRWGPGSGIYKTADGGANWHKLKTGLPTASLGRIGLKYYRAEPNTVYAIIESEKIGMGPAAAFMGINTSGASRGAKATLQEVTENGPADEAGLRAGDTIVKIDDRPIQTQNDLILQIRAHQPEQESAIAYIREGKPGKTKIRWGKRSGDGNDRPFAAYLGGQRPNAQKLQGEIGAETGGIFKSTDGGESWTRINSLNPRPFYYSQLHIDPTDDRNQFVLGVALHRSTDGGAEFQTIGQRVHPDHHALWIDPRDGRHLILGGDGGLYVSYDRGATWDFHNIMAIGQFYDVGLDTRSPYWAYGGLQDNGSWGAPTRKRGAAGAANHDWLRIGGGDGFVCRADPENPNLVYYESQGGKMGRVDLATGERARIQPPPSKPPLRFNWKTPFALSSHNSRIFYCAANQVFQSLNRGADLRAISPSISRTDRGSATALAESPLDPNVLYVGTDDGALWGTRDGGAQWTSIVENAGLPGHFHVSAIEPSKFAAGRAYVAFDGHRSDNDEPHLRVTEDYGATWTALNAGLPSGSTRTVREDFANPRLLFAGTEFGLYASLDRGRNWTRINNNLPTVAIHEIGVHPRENEIVAATHGRSLWVLDITPFRHYPAEGLERAHLFQSPPAVLWAGALSSYNSGDRAFAGDNPPFGALLHFVIPQNAKAFRLEIRDVRGDVIRTLPISSKSRGLLQMRWDLRKWGRRSPQAREQLFKQLDTNRDGALDEQDASGRLAAPIRQVIKAADADQDGAVSHKEYEQAELPPTIGNSRRPLLPVAPGDYLAVLTVDGQPLSQPLRVEPDPELPAAMLLEDLEQFDAKQRATFSE